MSRLSTRQKEYVQIDLQELTRDVEDIYKQLSSYGFLALGATEKECIDNSYTFSYQNKKTVSALKKSTEYNEEKLLEFRKNYGDKPPLTQILIEITKCCNERCIHCYIPHENKNFLMGEDDFYRIIDECVELGTVTDVKISGGECMSHPKFKEFIKYIKEKGFFLTVLSNLTLLDDEIIMILKTGSLSTVQTTLFSMDEKIHDKITQIQGSQKILLRNLEKLYHSDIPVAIATQILDQNKMSLSDIYDYANTHNFQVRCDYAIIAKEDLSTDNLKYVPTNPSSCFKEIYRVRMEKQEGYKDFVKNLLCKPLKNKNDYLCNACMNGVTVTPDLQVEPCPGWNLILGNLKKERLVDIWNKSPLVKRIRKATLEQFPKCVECENRSICNICMAQAYNEKSNNLDYFEVPQRVCNIYKLFREFASESECI